MKDLDFLKIVHLSSGKLHRKQFSKKMKLITGQ